MTDEDAITEVEEDDAGELITLSTIKAWYRADSQHSADWRQGAQEDFDYAAGNQWSEDDANFLREQERPVITFNRIDPVIDAVAGTEVNNRQEVRFIPRQVGASGVNEVFTGAAKWQRDECDAEDEESDAFRDLVICGMAWGETRMDYDVDPEGKMAIDRVDPLEMLWDNAAKKKNLTDARRQMRVKEMDKSDAEAMWPDIDCSELDATWAHDLTEEHDITERPDPIDTYQNDAQERKGGRKTVRVVEVQWWEKKPFYRVQDPATGEITELEAEQFEIANTAMQAQMGTELVHIKQVKRVYYRAFVGAKILEAGLAPCPFAFTYQAMTGKRDRNTGTFYGLVRPMKDPQNWANKWLSQALHILNTNAKGGLMAEVGAFKNPRTAKAEWSDPSKITLLNEGGLNLVKEKTMGQLPSGINDLMQFAIASIPGVTGVNTEMLGLADREQAGVLETTRQKTAVTILAPFFDALRRYRKNQGKIHAYFIQNYMSDGRLVRIVGDQGAQYVPLVRDPNVTTYDIIVDDAPTAPNQKEQVWATIQAMLPVVGGQLSPDMWAEIVKYSPLPESLSQKFSNLIMQQAQEPNPQAEQMAELQKQAVQAQVEKDKSVAALNIAKAGQENLAAMAQGVEFLGGYGPPPTAPIMGPSPAALQTAAAGVHDIALANSRSPQATQAMMHQLSQPQVVAHPIQPPQGVPQ